MQAHSQILVVSRDPMLLYTRKLVLGTYFEVEPAARLAEASSILSQREFDLLVLCDTLTPQECDRIAEMAGAHDPAPALLSIVGPGNKFRSTCRGRRLESGAGPLKLVRTCAEILGVPLESRCGSAQAAPLGH